MHLYGLGKLNSLSHEIADCQCSAENKHKSEVNDDVSFEQNTKTKKTKNNNIQQNTN